MAEFDEYRTHYDDQINEAVRFAGQDHDFFLRAKAEYLVEMAAREAWTDPRLLDVGCGDGAIDTHLLALRPEIALDGIDVAATVVEDARKRNPGVGYHAYDGDRLPFGDATYDIAFTINVMHHVPPANWQGFLNEMRRVVRPGGLVVVMEHNPYNPLTAHIVRTCPIDANAVLLRPGQLQAMAKAAGLAGVQRHFILFTPFKGPFFKAFDRFMGWLPLGAQYVLHGRVPGGVDAGAG